MTQTALTITVTADGEVQLLRAAIGQYAQARAQRDQAALRFCIDRTARAEYAHATDALFNAEQALCLLAAALETDGTDADLPPAPDGVFAHCISCGRLLESDGEQKDGLCYFCDPDEPLRMEVTEDGRQTAIYRKNRAGGENR